MQHHRRYDAACAAALAGSGRGKDAGRLDEKERAGLRKQALAWLHADLALWAEQARSDKPAARKLVREALRHWQDDADLAGLRTEDAPKQLPPGERKACQELWADVAALLRKIQENSK